MSKTSLLPSTLASVGPDRRATRLPAAAIEEQVNQSRSGSPSTDLFRAALLLWNDHLDEAHLIAQEIETPDGSMLHAIIHRREPDYFNSKYWWRRTGTHPSFEIIARSIPAILDSENAPALKQKLLPNGKWDPFAFVDAVQKALAANDANQIQLLERLQKVEMESFLEHCRSI